MRTPFFCISSAIEIEKKKTKAFVAQYTGIILDGTNDAVDAMFNIAPPPCVVMRLANNLVRCVRVIMLS